MKWLDKRVKFIQDDVKAWMYATLIYIIAISSILRSNYKYIDDLGRVAEGYRGWEDYSRFTSCVLSVLIHTDDYLLDISPLPQILCAAIMAISGVMLFRILRGRDDRIDVFAIVAFLPMGLSPYFLECFSYKYDAPYMAISVLGSILPLLLKEKNRVVYVVTTTIGTIIVYTTYQAASGIFPVLVVLIVVKKWNESKLNKEDWLYLLDSFLGYVSGALIFVKIIMRPINSYINPTIASPTLWISQIIEHYKVVITDFRSIWLVTIAIILVLFILGEITCGKCNSMFVVVVVSVLEIVVVASLCFGMYPFITTPTYYPRTMYAIGVVISAMIILVEGRNDFCGIAMRFMSVALSWMFISFSFALGNAYSEQQRYTDFRIQEVIDDLSRLEYAYDDVETVLQLKGVMTPSPILQNIPQDNTMLNKLVPSTFGEGWVWRNYYFYNYFNLSGFVENVDVNVDKMQLPILSETMYHTIYGNEEYILIEIK